VGGSCAGLIGPGSRGVIGVRGGPGSRGEIGDGGIGLTIGCRGLIGARGPRVMIGGDLSGNQWKKNGSIDTATGLMPSVFRSVPVVKLAFL
jgi:hypothetical protein